MFYLTGYFRFRIIHWVLWRQNSQYTFEESPSFEPSSYEGLNDDSRLFPLLLQRAFLALFLRLVQERLLTRGRLGEHLQPILEYTTQIIRFVSLFGLSVRTSSCTNASFKAKLSHGKHCWRLLSTINQFSKSYWQNNNWFLLNFWCNSEKPFEYEFVILTSYFGVATCIIFSQHFNVYPNRINEL